MRLGRNGTGIIKDSVSDDNCGQHTNIIQDHFILAILKSYEHI